MKEKNVTRSIITALMTIMVVFSMVQFSSFDSAAKSKKQQAVLTTTMECSVWSKPSTEEKYRVKKIPAGYQVTVYTTPVDSIKGDGKKYYQTVKGSYILCKCFEGEVTPGTGTVTQPVVTGYTPIQMIESASVTVSSEADVKRIYKEAIERHVEKLNISCKGISGSSVVNIISNEIHNGTWYTWAEGDLAYVNFTYWNSKVDVTLYYRDTHDQQIQMEATFAAILPSLNQGSNYDKIKAVHDYLCNSITYTYGYHDTYDALCRNVGVCQSYTSLFMKFMSAMGIPCYAQEGTVNGEAHVWNVVYLDGEWYHIDATWDDQRTYISRNYYLVGTNVAWYPSIVVDGQKYYLANHNYNYPY